MVKKLVIAVDCDDVLVSTTPFFVELYNKLYGTKGTLEQSHNSDSAIWQASEELQIERWFNMTKTEDYKKLAPKPEEVSVLRRLAEMHGLHLVTARKEEERAFTQSMLDQYLGGVFSSMEFVGWNGSKGDVCQVLQADVLIDDNFRHLASAYDCGVEHVVWFGNYPWQTEDPGDTPIIRCQGWQEVETEIERIAAS